jgi:hypothetical protein
MMARVPVAGRYLRWVVPIANHAPDWPLSKAQTEEWAILNTFDMFSPRYDQPQSPTAVAQWFEEAGLRDVWVGRKGFLVGRGTRPLVPDATSAIEQEVVA